MKIQPNKTQQFAVRLRGRAGMTLVEVLVAVFITGLTMSGVISGYIYCTTAAVKTELMQAAHARAMERLEQTRAAIWAPDRETPVDQLVASNFPPRILSLDLPGNGSNGVPVTVQTIITNLPGLPPTRLVRVDSIWTYRDGQLITNSVETIRAADQ